MKKFIGQLMLVVGLGFSVFNLFSISYGSGPFEADHYYYDETTIRFITLGILLLVTGILIIKNKKHA